MTKTQSLPAEDIDFLLSLASGAVDTPNDYNRLEQIRSALTDTDLPEGVEVTEPEGVAYLLSARDVEGSERPIRVFHNEWEIDLIISISTDADPYGIGPRMTKSTLPTGLRIDTI
jgi:hypothetical protein